MIINQKSKIKNQNVNGISLIEILVVIAVFAGIGILTARSIAMTLTGAKKSDSSVRVRENVNYALGVIERQIRNSEEITCLSGSSLSYVSAEGIDTDFSCASGYIASGSARLTSTDISITSCNFSCSQIDSNTPPTVTISITAEDTISTSIEKGSITSETEIVARNY